MNHPETPLKETITMYFGERHFDTLREFDHLKSLSDVVGQGL